MMSTDRELIDTRQKCQRLTTVLNPTLLFIFRLELFGLGLYFMPEYPNGTGSRLKICRLNCLRVRLPSPAPNPNPLS